VVTHHLLGVARLRPVLQTVECSIYILERACARGKFVDWAMRFSNIMPI
jgi:hypothetical protein